MAIEQILFRRGTAAQWTAANPVLAAGEPGYETDTGLLKIGDGSTAWGALDYQGGSGAGGAAADITVTPTGNIAATDVQSALAELDSEKVATSSKGVANGVASLGADGKVPSAQLPASAGGGGLLASRLYDPATEAQYAPSSKTVMTDVDATNAAVTFTAPASGVVTVHASFAAVFENMSGVHFGLREGTTDLPNTRHRGAYGASGLQMTFSLMWRISGLTPGSVHTYKLSHMGYGTATSPVSRAYAGGQWGPMVLAVHG